MNSPLPPVFSKPLIVARSWLQILNYRGQDEAH